MKTIGNFLHLSRLYFGNVFLILLFFLMTVDGRSQTIIDVSDENLFLRMGNRSFENGDFSDAIIYYKKALDINALNGRAVMRLAESYVNEARFFDACKWYDTADYRGNDFSIDNKLHYAFALYKLKKYEQARIWFDKYSEALSVEIAQNKNADDYKDSTLYAILHLGPTNTERSEFGAQVVNNKLYYSTTFGAVYQPQHGFFYDIYYIEVSDSLELGFRKQYNQSINSKYHEGPFSFYDNGMQFFFTRNIIEEKQKLSKLGIYSCKTPSSNQEKIDITQITINGFKHNMGHPATNNEGTKLYFISDCTDGFGGVDLYYTEKVDGIWAYPTNLGDAVNTRGNEMFPFLFKDSLLFFSSDGHNGMGGLDIYCINVNDSVFNPVHLPSPVNTSKDDFSVFYMNSFRDGFLASNRDGGAGDDDLYRIMKFDFKVKNNPWKKIPAKQTPIVIKIDALKEIKVYPNEKGEYRFSMLPGLDYTAVANKKKEWKDNEKNNEEFSNIFNTVEKDKLMMNLHKEMFYSCFINDDSLSIADNRSNVILDQSFKLVFEDTIRLQSEYVVPEFQDFAFLVDDSLQIPLSASNVCKTTFFVNNDTVVLYHGLKQATSEKRKNRIAQDSHKSEAYFSAEGNIERIYGQYAIADTGIVYRLQIAATSKPLTNAKIAYLYKGKRPVTMYKEDGLYKYSIAEVPVFYDAKRIAREELIDRYYIVPYKKGKKIAIDKALRAQYPISDSDYLSHPKGDKLLSATIYFDYDEFVVKAEYKNMIENQIVSVMLSNDNGYVVIDGHTDIRGSDSYNYGLGEERANSLKKFFIEKGIDPQRIKIHSYGKSRPVNYSQDFAGESEESIHQANRRAEIILFDDKFAIDMNVAETTY